MLTRKETRDIQAKAIEAYDALAALKEELQAYEETEHIYETLTDAGLILVHDVLFRITEQFIQPED